MAISSKPLAEYLAHRASLNAGWNRGIPLIVTRAMRLRRALCALPLLVAAVAAGGCTIPRTSFTDPGSIDGRLMVFWVGEDKFVYYPYTQEPLVYRLPPELEARLGVKEIRPGAIYTDGGSIPRAVRGLAGFSPWGYGPAYIVHDWLFVAHHCIQHDLTARHDPRDMGEVDIVRRVDFPLSADILSGVIQALIKEKRVPERGFAPDAIYTAVDSGFAKKLWNNSDPKSCDPLEQDEIRKIEFALRQRGAEGLRDADVIEGQPVLVYDSAF